VTQTAESEDGIATIIISAPPDHLAISAGFSITGGKQPRVTQMQPVGNLPNRWFFLAEGRSNENFTLYAYVICAKIV
jgi:hypothetical protein